jgi:sugar phosphate isomerase/epimerase
MTMWKFSVITDEISQDVFRAAALAREFGLTGLEIRSVFDRDAYHLTDADISAIRDAARAEGLSVCAVAPPFFKSDLGDGAATRAHLEGLKRCAEIAGKLGAKIVRGFGFWRAGEEIPYARIADEIRWAIPILEAADLTLALENDPSVFTPDGKTLAALTDAVSHPRVGALWDPGNVVFGSGERPFPDGYAALRGKIVHMHLKDARRVGGKPEAVAFGAGEVDYEGQFRALRADGYAGWMSVETHYRLDRPLSEAQMKRPAGLNFTAGGEAATADFLIHMNCRLRTWGFTEEENVK